MRTIGFRLEECLVMKNRKAIVLTLDVAENEYSFASSIETAIQLANDELLQLDNTILSVDSLRPSCDKVDYALAASSGAICGLIDIFLVGKPEESPIGNVSDKWFSNRVADFAKLNGWTEGCSTSTIKFLENKFKIPYDQTGRGIASEIFDLTPSNHHFKSLGHNPTLLGLFFSILDQFQNRSHFVTEGQLVILEDADDHFELLGNSLPAKFFCGFINWLCHLISDMSGSSQSKGRGMGIPSPLWAWTNDVIAIIQSLHLPIPEFVKNTNELALNIYKRGYDARFQAAHAVPVVVNELIVRLLYSVRRLIGYFVNYKRESHSFIEVWDACEPFTNSTVKRMLSVAHGTFCLLDISDATIRAFATGAGTFNASEFFMRLNIIGVGRFAISLYGEGKRTVDIHKAEYRAKLAEQEKAIVEDYLRGLDQLAKAYDDNDLVSFVDCFQKSEMFKNAFSSSSRLAVIRKVPEEKILRNKSDIDSYFKGSK